MSLFYLLQGSKKQRDAGKQQEKPTWDLTPNLLTPAMEEVIKMRSKRVSVEIDVPITPDPSDSEGSEPFIEKQGSKLSSDFKGLQSKEFSLVLNFSLFAMS